MWQVWGKKKDRNFLEELSSIHVLGVELKWRLFWNLFAWAYNVMLLWTYSVQNRKQTSILVTFVVSRKAYQKYYFLGICDCQIQICWCLSTQIFITVCILDQLQGNHRTYLSPLQPWPNLSVSSTSNQEMYHYETRGASHWEPGTGLDIS